jgi:plastocyanin
MIRGTLVTIAVGASALALTAAGFGRSTAAPMLRATVGPGFTISLTKSGKQVRSLKAGTYRFAIADRSQEHNFVLERQSGAKLERVLTSVPFTGTKTVTIKLTKGSWKFYCDPHASMMLGRFTVGGAAAAAGGTATTDDKGGHGEPEPGDDRGGR